MLNEGIFTNHLFNIIVSYFVLLCNRIECVAFSYNVTDISNIKSKNLITTQTQLSKIPLEHKVRGRAFSNPIFMQPLKTILGFERGKLRLKQIFLLENFFRKKKPNTPYWSRYSYRQTDDKLHQIRIFLLSELR